jgi:hypothetical protein
MLRKEKNNMTKKVITKDVDIIYINFAENGFILEYSGQTEDDNDWHTSKILVSNFDELVEKLKAVVNASKYKD